MKCIIIAGASRCGKTMISKYLKNKYGLNHYKMDSIKRGIDNNFWKGYQDNWEKVSPHMAKLINKIINEREDEYLVIDTCHLYPKDIYQYNIENTIIVFLGHDQISTEEKLLQIRKYDKNTWTNLETDESMRHNIHLGKEYSIEVRKQCEELNMKYFDTSYEFQKVKENVIRYLEINL